MNDQHQKLIRLGREHFTDIILPRLRETAGNTLGSMIFFLEGSVSYGFCDSHSDVDIDFYIDGGVDEAVLGKIRAILSSETFWHESVRISYGLGRGYWKFDLILKGEMERFWNEFNPYALYNIKKAVPVWDPGELMPKIRDKTDFYPDYTYIRVVRGLWITINDSGEYNAAEGHIFFYRALEALLRLIFLLNREYYPPTKWLGSGLANLAKDFGAPAWLEEIEKADSLEKKHLVFMKIYGAVRDFLLAKGIIERECLENYGLNFSKPFFVFNSF